MLVLVKAHVRCGVKSECLCTNAEFVLIFQNFELKTAIHNSIVCMSQ